MCLRGLGPVKEIRVAFLRKCCWAATWRMIGVKGAGDGITEATGCVKSLQWKGPWYEWWPAEGPCGWEWTIRSMRQSLFLRVTRLSKHGFEVIQLSRYHFGCRQEDGWKDHRGPKGDVVRPVWSFCSHLGRNDDHLTREVKMERTGWMFSEIEVIGLDIDGSLGWEKRRHQKLLLGF